MLANKYLINRSYLLFLLVAFVGSTVFTYYYFLYTNEYPPGSSERIANHNADKVFQTRILITSIGNILKPSIPYISKYFQWIIPYDVNYQVLLQLIIVFFTFGLLIILPYLFECFEYKGSHWASLFIMLPITWNYIIINGLVDGASLFYCYDIPSLTFFSLALTLFLKTKWFWFYSVFILACLNRESAAFISIAGFIINCNLDALSPNKFFLSNKTLIYHIVSQAIIWITLRLILSFVFRNNPGVFFEEPHSMLNFLSGIWTGQSHWAMQKPIWFLTLFAGVWLIPLLLYKNLNSSGKRLALVGIIYFITLIFRSNMMESRVYNELNVIIGICAIISLKCKKQNIDT